MTEKKEAAFSIIVGFTSLIAFGYFTSLGAAIALFFMLWANNLSQK